MCVVSHHQQLEASVTERLKSRGTELQLMHRGEETTMGVTTRPSSVEDPATP